MKIKIKEMCYEDVLKIQPPKHKKPKKQSFFFRQLLRILSYPELKKVKFTCNKIGMEKIKKGTPCFVLMNHSSFIDLKIASVLLGSSAYHIVCTSDGFVGKEWLMRKLGCIPTKKFQPDVMLLKDMAYVVNNLKNSVLMYPEASYSFDGTATAIPQSLGKCIKLLKVPVVMIRTYGAFSRDPLYNNLRIRNVNVSADMEYIITPEQIEKLSVDELNEILQKNFTFDGFRWQQQNNIVINEPFRADDLNRVLYKCPHCGCEEKMKGEGTHITCGNCGKSYHLTENGYLKAVEGETEFSHIPDWYNWQRECVKKELLSGQYEMQVPVTVGMMVDMKSIYRVGNGVLTHTKEGFNLVACDGKLNFHQNPTVSYSLYSDFYWYETSDIICIGGGKTLYYCFIEKGTNVSAKARLAAEELYKITTEKKALA